MQKIATLANFSLTVCQRALLTRVAVLAVIVAAGPAQGAEHSNVIQLTQTPCQFLESEGVDHKFKSTRKADCDAINTKTGAERLAKAEVMKLKPGQYVFRVTNKNVPYDLGFWFRSKDYDGRNPLHKLTKTSVSGGGLSPGTTKDYVVNLKPGEFIYSCPLNPTINYRVLVTEG
ncbi:MAG: hypothetical protein O3A85_08085 [Proteobacteria bacterium]|nr:hypothetical protein [Pseudomonadota bacterium]